MDPRGLSLKALRQFLEDLSAGDEREQLIEALEKDPRAGAHELAARARRSDEKARRREARWRAFCDPESRLHRQGYEFVAGVDEAGRGPLAGPVMVGAVILPPDFVHHPLDDSKRMTPRARQIAEEAIKDRAVAWATGQASPGEIDRHNIVGALLLAVERALTALDPAPGFALVDGRPLTSCPVPHRALVGGDGRCRAIAAASVLAKEERDRIMTAYDAEYPGYGFARHKGYGTAVHREALDRLGPTPIHRRSFLGGGRQLALPDGSGGESPQEWGKRAEEQVAADYAARGYEVLHRRWRGGGGELDLVCRDSEHLVVVEIKAARSERAGSPLAWLGPEQRSRLRQATARLLSELGDQRAGRELRFDFVGVIERETGPPSLTRIEGVEL